MPIAAVFYDGSFALPSDLPRPRMSAAERATTVCEQIRCRPTTISPWSASGCDGPAPLSEFKPEEQAALARYGAEGDASALRLTGLRFSKLGPRLHQRVPR